MDSKNKSMFAAFVGNMKTRARVSPPEEVWRECLEQLMQLDRCAITELHGSRLLLKLWSSVKDKTLMRPGSLRAICRSAHQGL